jgi:GAF domain-containing protein
MPDNREKDLLEVFVLLADELGAGRVFLDTIDFLVESSTTYTAAIEAGIMLADADGSLHVIASTSERAADVEESQLGLEQGPCLDAYRTGDVVEVPDIAASSGRWPGFADVADSRGLRAAHAVPLRLRADTVGGFNLFAGRVGRFSDRDASLAEAMAQMVTTSLTHHRISDGQASVVEQLRKTLDGRVVVEQAKGVLAYRHTVAVDDAFLILRRHARATGAGLLEVAENVVRRRIEI